MKYLVVAAALLSLVACSSPTNTATSPEAGEPNRPAPTAEVASQSAAPVETAAPEPSPSVAAPTANTGPAPMPMAEEPSMRCLMGLERLAPSLGALDQSWWAEWAAALNGCETVGQLRGAIDLFPDAIGAESPEDTLLPIDMVTLCGFVGDAEGLKYSACEDARALGYLPQS